MEIYFIRHGKTKENQKRLYYGTMDSGILQESRERLKLHSNWFLQQKFDKVYVSPLPRAVETARVLLPGEDLQLDSRLEERHFGIFEGKTYQEIVSEYPQQAHEWEEKWMTYEIPKGESFLQVQKRVNDFAGYLKKCRFKKILIVSHKGTMIQLMLALLGIPAEQYWKFTLESDCYSKIDYFYGNAVLTILNQKL
ncbi:MAG: histidine phosphatase family protein [Lachnospiraceae bacterium]|nr:histidine phosphatase family protein [Lachnospiraceae bacterium]